MFLGSILAATFAVHKYWPKGVIYGDKEHWEHGHHGQQGRQVKDPKKALRSEKSGSGSGSGSRRRRESVPEQKPTHIVYEYVDRDERRARYRETAREALLRAEMEREIEMEPEPEPEPPVLRRHRSKSRDRKDRPHSDSGVSNRRSRSGSGHRRSSSRELSGNSSSEPRRRNSYYPPAPRRSYYQEPVYVPSPKSRPGSVGSGGRRSRDGHGVYSR